MFVWLIKMIGRLTISTIKNLMSSSALIWRIMTSKYSKLVKTSTNKKEKILYSLSLCHDTMEIKNSAMIGIKAI